MMRGKSLPSEHILCIYKDNHVEQLFNFKKDLENEILFFEKVILLYFFYLVYLESLFFP